MKSISPIIASILIIVITVAIAGLFYAFTSGIFGSLSSSSNNLVNQQSQITSFVINNVYCSNNILYFNIYNKGNIPININNSQIIFTDNYGNTISVNGSNIICNNGNIINIGSSELCYINNYFCYYSYIDYIKSINFIFNGISYSTSSNDFILVPIINTIDIYNSQDIPTSSSFQQDIAICNGNPDVNNSFSYVDDPALFSAVDSNGQNIYFTTTYNSNPNIYSWYEGQENLNGVTCDVWWVNIPNEIPANSNITIYMYIGNSSANYYQQYYPYVGEAPQLSPKYAEYDNGNYVFLFYDNFAGTSLNTDKWSVYGSLTYSVNNSLSVTGSSSCGPGIESIATFSPPIIVEGYASFGSDSSTATNCYISGLGIWYTSGGGSNSGGQITHGWAPNHVQAYAINGWTGPSQSIPFWSSADNPQPPPNKHYVWGLGYISPSLAIGYVNYQQVSSTTTTIEISGSLTVIIDLQYNNVFPMYYYWFRVRSYPPNGVMPSIYIG